jgi:proteasome lid subunit RPN8/RPN11
MATDDLQDNPFDDDLGMEIELSDVARSSSSRERPVVRGWLGAPGDPAAARCFLHADAGGALLRHAMSATSREVGGILVGTVHRERGEFVLATGAIPARYSQESPASLTFTHASWQYMLAEQERRFPETVVVGWYHTHPGYGLFLSGQDLYIHRSFFTLAHQAAIVVDPIAGALAVFHLAGGRTIKESGVPLYGSRDDLPRLAPAGAAAPNAVVPAAEDRPTLMGDLAAGARMLDELADNIIASFERQVEGKLRGQPPSRARRDRKA